MLSQLGPVPRHKLSNAQSIWELAGQQFWRRRAEHYRWLQTEPKTTTSHCNVKGKYCFGVNKQIYSLHGMWCSPFLLPSTVKTTGGLLFLVWSLNNTKYLVETVSKISSKNEPKSRKSDLLDRQEGLEMLCWKNRWGKKPCNICCRKKKEKKEPVLHLRAVWL